MPKVLVVDDSEIDRVRVRRFLTQHRADLELIFAENGAIALDVIIAENPDAIVTDLQMPEMNGLELVQQVKVCCPLIPIILMTAEGSESIAAEALNLGAVSYVPKSTLKEHLPATVDRTLEISFRDREHSRLMHSLVSSETEFLIENDPDLIEMVTNFYQEMLRTVPLKDESERFRVATALKHALWHVWYFGNLEIDPSISDEDQFRTLVKERCEAVPYANRSLTVAAQISPAQAEFRITHEGAQLSLPSEKIELDEAPFLRGFTLICAIMDDIQSENEGMTMRLRKNAKELEELVTLDVPHSN